MRRMMSQLLSHSWPSAVAAAMILTSGAVTLLAAWHDVVSRTVPNWMPVSIACFGIVAAFADHRLMLSPLFGVAVCLPAAFSGRPGWRGGPDVRKRAAIKNPATPKSGLIISL